MKKTSLSLALLSSICICFSTAFAEDAMKINVADPLADTSVDSVNTDDTSPSNADDSNVSKCNHCKKCKCTCAKDDDDQASDD